MPFIALDGLPGSGKTTLRDEVIRRFAKTGMPVHHVGQHGWLSSKATEIIVGARKGAIQPSAEALVDALLDDKSLHYECNVEPCRTRALVIADRYTISDLFLLSAAAEKGFDRYLSGLSCLRLPAVTFFLDCPLQIVHARLAGRKGARFLDSPFALHAAASVLQLDLLARVNHRVVFLESNTSLDIERAANNILRELDQLSLKGHCDELRSSSSGSVLNKSSSV